MASEWIAPTFALIGAGGTAITGGIFSLLNGAQARKMKRLELAEQRMQSDREAIRTQVTDAVIQVVGVANRFVDEVRAAADASFYVNNKPQYGPWNHENAKEFLLAKLREMIDTASEIRSAADLCSVVCPDEIARPVSQLRSKSSDITRIFQNLEFEEEPEERYADLDYHSVRDLVDNVTEATRKWRILSEDEQ